jgi:hypothetical protein
MRIDAAFDAHTEHRSRPGSAWTLVPGGTFARSKATCRSQLSQNTRIVNCSGGKSAS